MPASTVKMPAARAWRLTRPVAAGLASMLRKLMLSAICVAAVVLVEVVSRENRGDNFVDAAWLAAAATSSAVSTMRLAKPSAIGRRGMREHGACRPSQCGTGPNFTLLRPCGWPVDRASERRWMTSRQHRDSDLGRARCADVQADRRMDAGDLARPCAERQKPLDALGVRLAAAQRADIEAAGIKRGLQREIVDLRIVRHGGQCAIAVERSALQHDPRAIRHGVRTSGKRSARGKSSARIDDLQRDSRRSSP